MESNHLLRRDMQNKTLLLIFFHRKRLIRYPNHQTNTPYIERNGGIEPPFAAWIAIFFNSRLLLISFHRKPLKHFLCCPTTRRIPHCHATGNRTPISRMKILFPNRQKMARNILFYNFLKQEPHFYGSVSFSPHGRQDGFNSFY